MQSIVYWTADICSPFVWTANVCSPVYDGLLIFAVHVYWTACMDCGCLQSIVVWTADLCSPFVHGLQTLLSIHSWTACICSAFFHALQEAVIQSVRDLERMDADADVSDFYSLTRKATQACRDRL